MRLTRLTVEGIRNLHDVDIALGPDLQFFKGDNGAGKTSVLEAVYCLSSGRSFRGGVRAEFINREQRQATVFATINVAGREHKLGLTRSSGDWQARLNGEDVASLGDLARCLAVLCFHPRLHQLIEGAPDERRRFLDFGVFHVEQGFLDAWRHYRRALKQRNAALRSVGQMDFRVWDAVMIDSGNRLTAARKAASEALSERFEALLGLLGPDLDGVRLVFHPGWRATEAWSEALAGQAERDRHQGHTTYGPHRADLHLVDDQGRVAGRLSRGQQKIVVLAMTLAMRQLMAARSGQVPILCVDDFASELDQQHQGLVLQHLVDHPGQVLLTGTEMPADVLAHCPDTRVFHVEHGQVREML